MGSTSVAAQQRWRAQRAAAVAALVASALAALVAVVERVIGPFVRLDAAPTVVTAHRQTAVATRRHARSAREALTARQRETGVAARLARWSIALTARRRALGVVDVDRPRAGVATHQLERRYADAHDDAAQRAFAQRSADDAAQPDSRRRRDDAQLAASPQNAARRRRRAEQQQQCNAAACDARQNKQPPRHSVIRLVSATAASVATAQVGIDAIDDQPQ